MRPVANVVPNVIQICVINGYIETAADVGNMNWECSRNGVAVCSTMQIYLFASVGGVLLEIL